MATILLSAVGFSAGSVLGSSVLGLSSAVLGKAVGATFGRLIDQRLFGQGSDPVTTGKVDRFRLNGVSEGASMARVFGRMRLAGQVIWASRFKEVVVSSGGSGKGTPRRSATSRYSYSVSLALALCEGEATGVGRIWADGVQLAKDDLNLRFYPGDNQQLPDPKIVAVEGALDAPSYRGTAYVVFEDLDLTPFGNRVPQFNFEVFRAAQPEGGDPHPIADIRGVALMPGSGEYTLATTPVHFEYGLGVNRSTNVNSPSGKSDLQTSLEDLRQEVPGIASVSLISSWFGDDLRCNTCTLKPKVEQNDFDGIGMAWNVSSQSRSTAALVSSLDDRPVFGGTPSDASVIEAIKEITQGGQEVMFYPFILMDIQTGNALPDPYSTAVDQPVMPWRGRIGLSVAPGLTGSPDQSAAAEAEVAAFFGTVQASDFTQSATGVSYSGPVEWRYRRFILHYAHLCAAAGGVASFCIGSELRALSQIRGAAGGFPVVDALKTLAADVRGILGAGIKIGYAADWSEYFGYHPQDGSGDVYFHLDPLWSDVNVDFIGIDNYMPLSDWRDADGHLDEGAGSIYNLEYLEGNVAGGEGFEWYYASTQAREAQIRSPISDGAYGEDWLFRYKDLKSWWGLSHHDRVNGQRMGPSLWVPESKPIWFTEFGCAAIDKGSNQPNVFLDPKSSESSVPYFSNGRRDDLIQAQYLRASFNHWRALKNNPVSGIYNAPMVDMDHAHVWAWDARPWPEFPNNLALWSDGENYARGHWINGRLGAQNLSDVVAEIAQQGGVSALDLADLYGNVKGYVVGDVQSARAALQVLMLAYGFDAVERGGKIRFANRHGTAAAILDPNLLVWSTAEPRTLHSTRLPEAETAGKVRLNYIQAYGAYEPGATEAIFPGQQARAVSQSELPLVLSASEARAVVERWLAESRVARDVLRFGLPPSQSALGAGDVVALPEALGGGRYRIDRIEEQGARQVEATRVEGSIYTASETDEAAVVNVPFVPPVPVFPLFMDLPLLLGNEVEHAPHLAVTATPWPGSVAVYSGLTDAGYSLNTLIEAAAVVGETQVQLFAAKAGLIDRSAGLRVKIFGGDLQSVVADAVLNGANLAAIGPGSGGGWEVFQFTTATLVGADLYDLTDLLRGQAGTEAIIPGDWPVGSKFVLLNSAVQQIELAASARDLARHYRVGPALRAYDDPSYVHESHAFSGIGLRPYAPAHLRVTEDSYGDMDFSWIRRSRVDGDSWSSVEVPLGEEFESYHLKVSQAGVELRLETVSSAVWNYPASQRLADGITGDFSLDVAQISARFGPGLYQRIDVND